MVGHLVRHKRQAEGGGGGDTSWMDNVGGYLDTVGEWLNTAAGFGEPIMGKVNFKAESRSKLHINKIPFNNVNEKVLEILVCMLANYLLK